MQLGSPSCVVMCVFVLCRPSSLVRIVWHSLGGFISHPVSSLLRQMFSRSSQELGPPYIAVSYLRLWLLYLATVFWGFLG
uniref:Uncharacterized protein n=1 Tax=Ixodes scapularis TaxID=6945 RepID=A0A4D5RY20_IXOSC